MCISSLRTLAGQSLFDKEGDGHAMSHRRDGDRETQRRGVSNALVCSFLVLINVIVLLDLVNGYLEPRIEAVRSPSAAQDADQSRSPASIPWHPHPQP